jgi:exosortase/archaeosortase family protein
MNRIIQKLPLPVQYYLTSPKWAMVRGVILFCIITVLIHVVWKFWSGWLNFWPVMGFMQKSTDTVVSLVLSQSSWLTTHLLGIRHTVVNSSLLFDNGGSIFLGETCSGFKQITQFIVLMFLFPGPWKHKAWFIPAGVIVIHLTNIFRVLVIAFLQIHKPTWINFMHDEVLRILFYIVIFCLWLIWVEKIAKPKKT